MISRTRWITFACVAALFIAGLVAWRIGVNLGATQRGDGGFKVRSQVLGAASQDIPWITDLTIGDLDRDGRLDVVYAEGRLNRIGWLRQQANGGFEEQVLAADVAGPAHVEVVDLDQDGDMDVLVAGMGIVTPNNDRIGAVIVLENDGGRFRVRTLVEQTYRVTDVQAGDLDGDGDLDLAVAKFGYLEGEVVWLENRGNWHFDSHVLLDLPGAIHVPIADVDADGDLDVLALVSQDWEEVYCFDNDGRGNFSSRVVAGSTNRDFGSSGLAVADVDQDGDSDLVLTNGDGFDYATPGSRPWHGVQWLENDGRGRFTFRRIGEMSGAYSPCVVDIDGDGDRDIVVSSGFNDWRSSDAIALAVFENDGRQQFVRRTLAFEPTHLIVVDTADFDGDGRPELVTGGLCFYPPYERSARLTHWRIER